MASTMKILVSYFLFILSCLTLNSSEYLIYVDEVIRDFAKEIEEELYLENSGSGGRMPRDVEKISVIFCANRRASIEEARDIEVFAVKRLLEIINSHEKIRPFLREHPFNANRVDVTINFNNFENDRNYDGSVTFMFLSKGRIIYCAFDPITGKFIDLLDESFEEAQKIVESNPKPISDLRIHKPTPYEAQIDKLYADFAREAKKKWGIYCVAEGGKLADGIEEMAIRFNCPRRVFIDEARALEVAVTERFLEIINNDPLIRPYLKEYPMTVPRAKVLISFKKRDGDYYTSDGSIAIVQQADNQISYSKMRPDTKYSFPVRPDPLGQESYEEAKASLQNSPKKPKASKINSFLRRFF